MAQILLDVRADFDYGSADFRASCSRWPSGLRVLRIGGGGEVLVSSHPHEKWGDLPPLSLHRVHSVPHFRHLNLAAGYLEVNFAPKGESLCINPGPP
jgi:hypothetical protein